MTAVKNRIQTLINEHKCNEQVGITSICSVNEYVIKAAILNAKKLSSFLLIESTSNQVDQFGGYTGMKPNDFRDFVYSTASSLGFPATNIILGGDHLGPNVWSDKPANYAMKNAEEQIRYYINARFSKIHLDTSMRCADDDLTHSQLSPQIIAERAAKLCRVAEEEVKNSGKINLPVYVIGTDVPPPGGAKDEFNSMHITTAEEVEETISLSRRSFTNYELEDAWSRVIAVVVQPGVEFGEKEIIDYNRNKAVELTKKIETKVNFVYEAHSTDFQLKESLKQMVEDHFAILKVGPWLTYTFREAVFALEMIEKELMSTWRHITLSELSQILELCMLQNSVHWRKYYTGLNEEELRFKRKYSLSDRIRYYWNENPVRESLGRLFFNLSKYKIPLTLISQFLPESYESVRDGEIENIPEALIINRITKVIEKYNYATTIKKD